MAGDLKTAEWTGGFVPGADPVDRSGHGKGGELGVAGDDGFIGDSLFDVATDRGIDAALERPDQLAGLGGEFVFVEHGDAPAEVVKDDRSGVGFDVDLDLVKAAAATDQCLVEKGFDEGNAGMVALDEDLFLVAKIVVKGWLGDLKTLGQVAHRGAAITLLEEHVGRSL